MVGPLVSLGLVGSKRAAAEKAAFSAVAAAALAAHHYEGKFKKSRLDRPYLISQKNNRPRVS